MTEVDTNRSTGKPRVLVVDDEPENIEYLTRALKKTYEVVTASSGDEGLSLVRSQPFAIILSDHRMSGMTGVEFLSRVRAVDPKTMCICVAICGMTPTMSACEKNAGPSSI